jgi:branched-chain amino acid transport system permease protein
MSAPTIPLADNRSIRARFRNILLDWDKTQILISFVVLFLIALTPLFVKSPYYLGIIILTTLYILSGISWNIVAGFAGQLLIAHIIFLATGAYTTIVLYNTFGVSPWIGIPIAGVMAALLGLGVAAVTLRYGLKMDYFALFTIALMVAMRALFLKWKFVGGAIGMGLSLSNPGWEKMIFPTKPPYLYIVLVLTVAAVVVQYLIYRSKMGKYFMAIREDDAAAAAVGVNTSRYKTYALLIGSAMAGIAGGFYAMYVTYVEPPQVFNLGLNVEIIMAAPIIGGLGSLAGPVLGGILNKPLAEFIRGFMSAGRSGTTLIVYGSFLILAILFMPRGVTGLLEGLYRKLRRRWAGDDMEEG